MDINKILQDLGIDLTNQEAKRGAVEAIDAILSSRIPPIAGMSGGGGEVDVEIDPDLVQPSPKHNQPDNQDDIEIEDDEGILSQVKTNKPENKPDQNKTSENDSDSSKDSGEASENTDNTNASSGKKSDDDAEDSDEEEAVENDEESEETGKESDDSEDSDEDGNYVDSDEEADYADSDEDDDDTEVSGADDYEADDDGEQGGGSGGDGPLDGDKDEESDEEDSDEEDDFDEDDFDDGDILGDPLKGIQDETIANKAKARRIKRDRTLTAAKVALDKAKSKNAPPALIRELEKAIDALESLTEAVKAKHIDDISDDEFNMLVNRVFDAIDALGDNSLTYSSDEERQQKVKEIKADLGSTETQHELSAEDAAAIRAEHQATKAREKESAKYQRRGASSFKGFQDFLNSLYRAVALQVSSEEARDASWSAISRRNSGTGVLQQGNRIKDLNNKKIPVIDFYFDISTSWNDTDLAIGNKAADALGSLEADGKIKVNRYYFGDRVANTPDRRLTGGCTSGWNEIVKNIISTQATNVIIMTDDDMENWWEPQDKPPLAYTVPGYVWYLWKNGVNAQRLPRDLKGRGGVQQFSFSASDL